MEIRHYPLDKKEFYSLSIDILHNYPIDEAGENFLELIRPEGHIVLVNDSEGKRLTLIGNDEKGIEELLKELKEKTNFQIH